MRVTVIIVTYNSASVIQSALACVYEHQDVAQCIVVDNASEDGTLQIIRENFPRVRIIKNVTNVGFGRAVNQALETVTTEFALLMNPDAVIAKEGLMQLLKIADTYPRAVIIAPVLPEHGDDPTTVSMRLPAIYTKNPVFLAPTDNGNVYSVGFVSGAIALWRMEDMRKVGFFDPAFFLFYEDDDISVRVVRAGYELLLATGIEVEHIPGTSCVVTDAIRSLKIRSSAWSRLYIHSKYRGNLRARVLAVSLLLRSLLNGALYYKVTVMPENAKEARMTEQIAKLQKEVEKTMHELEQRHAKAVEKHARWWHVLEEQYNKHRQAKEEQYKKDLDRATVKQWKELSAVNKIREAEEALNAKREKKWQEMEKEFEVEWALLIRNYEETLRTIHKKFETERSELAQAYEARWTSLMEKKDKQWWKYAIIRRDQHRHNDKRAAARDRVWAALYFLKHPDRFTVDS